LHYEGNIIRPPSEANSILLQITVGCSRNKCTFCGAYKGERFRIKPDSIIMEDIAFAAYFCKRQRRVFLCDGDALIVPQKRLLNILFEIEKQLPWVTRVGVYANAKSLKMKTLDELKTLKAHGLGIVYLGLETGDDVTLNKIRKGATSEQMIQMGKKSKGGRYQALHYRIVRHCGQNTLENSCPRNRPGTFSHRSRIYWRTEPYAHPRYAAISGLCVRRF